MKMMSVLEVDQHWEVARKALKADKGIVVTRDGEVVGHLIPADVDAMEVPRKRFDPEENRKRRESLMEGLEPFNSTPALMESREDRKLL
jgi:hypothetical protein